MLPNNENILIIYVAGSVFTFVLVAFIIIYVYLHQAKVNRFNIHIREQELKKQQELFIALQNGEEKERKRLAEELHDGIGARLSGLNMSIEYLKMNPDQHQALLEKISTGMNETINELREISQNLQPSFLLSKGLETALAELISHLNNKECCYYQLFVETNWEVFNTHIQINIYRIISELLHNVKKHAAASQASAQVIGGDGMVQIIVEDNGTGFANKETGMGIGLLNIKNRVDLCKGKLLIDTSVKGTVIIVELPVNNFTGEC
ncbi:MAG: hypothetical protein H7296_01615 [Bacteroidia bacterium]|nr:hypothetical protein [Bacteroidia bacterium]